MLCTVADTGKAQLTTKHLLKGVQFFLSFLFGDGFVMMKRE